MGTPLWSENQGRNCVLASNIQRKQTKEKKLLKITSDSSERINIYKKISAKIRKWIKQAFIFVWYGLP